MNEELKYQFRLPIGDWIGYGHGDCEWFIVSSNKSIDEVAKLHFKIKTELGVDIHLIDHNEFYDEPKYAKMIEIIKQTKFDFKHYLTGNNYHPSVENLAELWIHLMMYLDKDLILKFTEIEMLHFFVKGNGDYDEYYDYDDYTNYANYVGIRTAYDD